ncbi:hypothetical protein [Aliikangiella sp. G2MR2-5]|uniref:hypothetical protein n=1 Tax=Aliikangiella sp. G2MR2-5 TaxID=2788943 RepID=UPI0018AC7A7A|nr:hypothetical protein [Aliikangiella sp. G2MR2-5]
MNITQRQALNIIIMATAVMFLLFLLIGKKLEKSIQSPERIESSQLVKVDFGKQQLIYSGKKWDFVGDAGSSVPSEVAAKWRLLLASESQNATLPGGSSHSILLYFEGKSQPLLCQLLVGEKELHFFFTSDMRRVDIPIQQRFDYLPRTFFNE